MASTTTALSERKGDQMHVNLSVKRRNTPILNILPFKSEIFGNRSELQIIIFQISQILVFQVRHYKRNISYFVFVEEESLAISEKVFAIRTREMKPPALF